ncbi:MAG: glutathione S-transferase [Hyphomicrobiales bacterium]|nr:glutathione S-transferase [Hyphomicrobiales bacterium]
MAYELFYWPQIPGRGEFVRLALEEAGADYVDVCRVKGRGTRAMMTAMYGKDVARPPFAAPFLRDGEVVIGQTANILLYLGGRLKLAPRDEAGKLWTHQIQLTIADCAAEAHDTHHPIAVELYYEDQKPEAKRRAKSFREERIPKFLDWFEAILDRNPSGPAHLVGRKLTYADLSLYCLVDGLCYAFPRAMAGQLPKRPKVAALAEAVRRRPRIAAYLGSPRRAPWSEQDLFRHYPELDGPPREGPA